MTWMMSEIHWGDTLGRDDKSKIGLVKELINVRRRKKKFNKKQSSKQTNSPLESDQ